jgi:Predicted membrane protein
MESLLLLVFVASLVMFIGGICGLSALFKVNALNRELSEVRHALSQLQSKTTTDADALPTSTLANHTAEAHTEPVDTGRDTDAAMVSRDSRPLTQEAQPSGDNRHRLAWLERAKQQWLVWSGAGIFTLGGLFLISYLISEGYFPPLARLGLGALFGVGLIVGSEWLHDKLRRYTQIDWPSYVPAAIASAGFISLFGLTLMAATPYQFISEPVAVVMLALSSLAATFYGLRFGPLLTVVGLIGAYGAPLFSTSATPSYGLLASYFLLVAAAITYVAQRVARRWLWYSLWGVHLAWLFAFAHFSVPLLIVTGFALGSVYLLVAVPKLGWLLKPTSDAPLSWRTLVDIRAWHHHALDTWLMLAIMFIASTAAFSLPFTVGMPLIAALVAWLYLAPLFSARWDAWPVLGLAWVALWLWFGDLARDPLTQQVGLGMGVITLLYGLALGKRSPQRIHFIWLACLATPFMVSLNAMVTGAFWGGALAYASSTPLWAACLAGGGAVLAAFTRHFKGTDQAHVLARLSLWCGVNAHLALALTLLLSDYALTLALTAQAVVMLWLSHQYRTALANWVIQALLSVVLARATLLLLATHHMASLPDTLWLYPSLGLLIYIGQRWVQNRTLPAWLTGAQLQLAALWLTSATLWLCNLQGLTSVMHSVSGAVVMSMNWLLLACVYLYRARAAQTFAVLYRIGGLVLLVLSALIQFILFFEHNPYVERVSIGDSPLTSLLWPWWGVPLLACVWLAKWGYPSLPLLKARVQTAVSSCAAVFGFLLVNGLVRQAWQGDTIALSQLTSHTELYTYSLVWLAIGSLSLLGGYWQQSVRVQQGAMAMLALVILKVFLVDMASLEGLMRALSFIGLGLCLVALGGLFQWLKQRQWAA